MNDEIRKKHVEWDPDRVEGVRVFVSPKTESFLMIRLKEALEKLRMWIWN